MAREKLEILDLHSNNFNQDLTFLSDLVSLKELYLGNISDLDIRFN